MKLVLRILIGVGVVFLLLVLGAFFFVDSLAVQAVERGGSYALGVPTELDSADIGLFSGEFGLAGLSVANPPGYEQPDFLTLREARLEVATGSVLSDRVSVPLLELSGIALDLEKNAQGTNYGAILDNLGRFESQGPAPAEEEAAGGGKSFVLERLVVRDVTVRVDLLPMGGEATEVTLSIPEIVLANIGQELSLAEICALVVKTILSASLEAGAGVLPADFLKDLGGRLKGLEALPDSVAEQVGGALDQAAQELGGEAGKTLQGASEKLEGLFKKKD
jgi:hypothetical protein